MPEDNTVFVLQKALRVHKAKVTKDSVKEFLLSQPSYPSLKSVCDGLKKWCHAKMNNGPFEKLKIPGTPTIYVNGYRFPGQYKLNDIDYLTTEITSLTMESKGQEACSHCR